MRFWILSLFLLVSNIYAGFIPAPAKNQKLSSGETIDEFSNNVKISTTTLDEEKADKTANYTLYFSSSIEGLKAIKWSDGTVQVSSPSSVSRYIYTILLKESSSNGSDTTTSSTWEDKLEVKGKWNKFIDSSTIISAKAYTYMRIRSTGTASTVSALTGVKVGGNWYYSPQRDVASNVYQDFPEVIDIPASAFADGLDANLDVKLRTKSDDGQTIYYYLERAYLVIKTRE